LFQQPFYLSNKIIEPPQVCADLVCTGTHQLRMSLHIATHHVLSCFLQQPTGAVGLAWHPKEELQIIDILREQCNNVRDQALESTGVESNQRLVWSWSVGKNPLYLIPEAGKLEPQKG